MPQFNPTPIWKHSPFVRILLPLCLGILLQWYWQIPTYFIYILLGITIAVSMNFYFLSISSNYKLQLVKGIFLFLLIVSAGLLLTHFNNSSKNKNWYGNAYKTNDFLLVRIDEPPVEKNKSYKADAFVEAIIRNDSVIHAQGKILLYFSKDSAAGQLKYGDKIVINKNIQPIKNAGNPGGFNYKRYASFQQLFHNAFLKDKDWEKTTQAQTNYFKQF